MSFVSVAIAGGIGAVFRYTLSGMIARNTSSNIPYGTLAVNVAGSLALGVIVGMGSTGRISDDALRWAGTGFLGAFTTFSTFSYETIELVVEDKPAPAAVNVFMSLLLCFAGAAIGYSITA